MWQVKVWKSPICWRAHRTSWTWRREAASSGGGTLLTTLRFAFKPFKNNISIHLNCISRGFSSRETYMCWKSIFVRESGFGQLQTVLYLHSSTNAPSHKFHCTNKFQKGVRISPLDIMHSLADDVSQNLYIHEVNPQKIIKLMSR